MEVRTIKGIGREKWRKFKELAFRKEVSMGKMFEILIEDFSKKRNDVWDEILDGEKILSDKEAKDLEKEVKKLRKEKGFRI